MWIRSLLSAAMAAYARQAKDQELILWATEIKVRAERRAGEMLTELPRGGKFMGRDEAGDFRKTIGAKTETTEKLGISKDQSARWQALAAMPEEHFETAVATAKESACISQSRRSRKQARFRVGQKQRRNDD